MWGRAVCSGLFERAAEFCFRGKNTISGQNHIFSVIFEGFRPREVSQTLRHVIFIDSAPLSASKSFSGTRFWPIIAICKICNLYCFFSFSGNPSLPPPTHGLWEYFIVRHSIPPISFKDPYKIISSSNFCVFLTFVFLHRAYKLKYLLAISKSPIPKIRTA